MGFELNQILNPVIKPAITREQLQEYANASGDHNPIHLDEKFAKEGGFPSVIVHGMLSMAFMADCLAVNFPASQYEVKRMKCRFRKVTYPGDVIRCEAKVKALNPDGSMTVGLWTENQKSEITTEGEAQITIR